MDKRHWLGLGFVVTNLLLGMANASDDQASPGADFLEFLGEGKTLDGDYYDPLQMQDWIEKEMVDAGQQQEVNEHE